MRKFLSRRQVEILRLIAQGRTNREIAEELRIRPRTVVNHLRSIRAKTGYFERVELAIYALKLGIISLDDIDLPVPTRRKDL